MRTNIYLKKNLDAMIAGLAVNISDQNVLDGVRIMNSARERYLEQLYACAKTQCGSMDGFLKERLGIGKEEKRRLAELYLI